MPLSDRHADPDGLLPRQVHPFVMRRERDPEFPEAAYTYAEAVRDAMRRVRRHRRGLSQEAAEAMVREEFARHGMRVSRRGVAQMALTFRRASWWPLLHPRQAKREGWKFWWPWSND